MSQKNETGVLALALFITAALIAGGFWWFTKSGVNLGKLATSNPNNSPANPSNPNLSSPASAPPNSSKTFAQVSNIPSGLFNYGGSTSWAPIRQAADSNIQAAHPEFRLHYVQPVGATPSSDTGIKMLLNGQLDFAQSSRPLGDDEKKQAQQQNFQLDQIPIALDGLAVAVNPNLKVQGLTLEQLKSIYTGTITNWKQLNGPDLPIKPYSRRKGDSGTVELFSTEILGGQPFGSNVTYLGTTTEALRQLGTNPGGIYYASAPEVVPQCTIKPLPLRGPQSNQFIPPYQEPFVSCLNNQHNQLNIQAFQSGQYPITRNLFVVVKKNGQREQQAGEAYANLLLTEQGQDLISKAGFVRIR